MILSGGKIWFTAQEIADFALPGLPKAKRKVNERAEDERWALKVDPAGMPLARPRQGRGGGLEYHLSILPAAARAELVKRGVTMDVANDDLDVRQTSMWSWFDGQNGKIKAKAEHRMAVIAQVELFEQAGMTRSGAVTNASKMHGTSASTIWNWLALVEGVAPCDRLPHLAPRFKGGGAEAALDPRVWQFLISDYLRPEGPPTFTSCYDRAVTFAATIGQTLPHPRTLLRKIERDIDPRLIIAKRSGVEALRQTVPPQQRTVASMHAMELVNIDGHKFDVFVKFPDGRIGRPLMIAIADIYSRKFLSWRFGETENAVQTRLAFADLFRKWGIPKGCLLDNGRAFASKWITGGALSRFRFKIREDEPTGLLTSLGIQIHWATPYRGQSKPIERAFRDICSTIATHPAFAGAYTGNRPDAKPENYGARAIPWDEFVRIANAGMHAHNAKLGRRTEMAQARGLSFDQVFEESYRAAPIGKATPEHLRKALLTGEQIRADRKSGHITVAGNRYWAPELSRMSGKLLTIRFDPDDLHQDIHVYTQGDDFVCSAPIYEATGFLDMGAAKARARQEGNLKKAARELERQQDLLTAAQIAAMLPDYSDETDAPEPTVVRAVRHRGNTAAALKPLSEPARAHPRDQYQEQISSAFGALRLVE